MLTERHAPIIVATVVPEGEAMQEALSAHFGKYMRHVEDTVFSFGRQLTAGTVVAVWDFIELSNGGFFIRPRQSPIHMTARSYGARVSGDALGIVSSLLAFEYLWVETRAECMADHALRLRRFVDSHVERTQILAALKAME